MATPNYDINYDDERFTKVESDKQAALTEVEKTYGGMISESDKFYKAQIDANKQWADTQSKLQQDRTDFAIEQINQQKDQAKKDYTKEQSGAYVDWQKQSNPYGANAEKMASQGMLGTGYSESSQVSKYNTYQNRVATAREAYTKAILNYDNAIKEAMLQNNSALAEIAYETQLKQLELALEGFQYNNSLTEQLSNKKMEVENNYYNRYQDVLNQINQENALAEQIRQYEKDYAEGVRQFNEEIARLKAKDAQEHALEIQRLELQKAQLEEEKRQFDATKAKNDDLPIKDDDPSINMASVQGLGYGNISAEKLNNLVATGAVLEYEKDGQLYYKRAGGSGSSGTGAGRKNFLMNDLKQ